MTRKKPHGAATIQADMSEDDISRAEKVLLWAKIGIENGLRTKGGADLFGPRAQVKAHLKIGRIEILAENAIYVINLT